MIQKLKAYKLGKIYFLTQEKAQKHPGPTFFSMSLDERSLVHCRPKTSTKYKILTIKKRCTGSMKIFSSNPQFEFSPPIKSVRVIETMLRYE